MNTEREADFRLPSLMRQNSPAATKRTGRRTPPPGYGRQNSPSVLRQNGPSVTILLQTINSFFFCMSVCMISFIQVGSIKFLPRTCQSLRPIYRCDKMSTKDLKKLGFKFVGSTIIYAYMQAIGIVNDHVKGCHLYANK